MKIVNSPENDVNDMIVFRSKIIAGASIEDVKKDLETMCLMGYDYALLLWYEFFKVGESPEIDEIVESFTAYDFKQARENIVDLLYEEKRTTDPQEKERLNQNWILSVRSLIRERKSQPPAVIKTHKELTKFITANCEWFGSDRDFEQELTELLESEQVYNYELFDVIGSMVHRNKKLNSDAKKIIKTFATSDYSQGFYDFQEKNNQQEIV